MNTWNPHDSLEELLASLPGSATEFDHDARLPDALRPLYQHAILRELVEAEGVCCHGHDDVELQWDASNYRFPPPWDKTAFCEFGMSDFGDSLLLVTEGPRAGTVVVTDHEQGGDVLYVLGDSVADWLARTLAVPHELALYPGNADELDAELVNRYARDHLRLNPDSEWAARLIWQHDNPGNDRLLGWDARLHTLVPIEEMEVEHLQVVQAGDRHLQQLAGCKGLRSLELFGGDYTPQALGKLGELVELKLQDAPDLGDRDLEALPALKTLRLSDTKFDRLGELSHLEDLEIENSTFDDLSKVSALTKLRTLVLAETPITSLRGIEALHALELLSVVVDGPIKDLRPAEHLPNLQRLAMYSTTVPKAERSRFSLARPDVELAVI